jgi:hypothetical protein
LVEVFAKKTRFFVCFMFFFFFVFLQVYEKMTGVVVAALKTSEAAVVVNDPSNESKDKKLPILDKDTTLQALPQEWPVDTVDEVLEIERSGHAKVLVVLDDDPTGTQTVYGVTVLTEWCTIYPALNPFAIPDC